MCSNCNLNIEKCHYLKLPVEQRICQLCHMDVEDEFHFLMNCDKLIHECVTLFRNISDFVPSFRTMSDLEKFMFLLTSHDLDGIMSLLRHSILRHLLLRLLILLQ